MSAVREVVRQRFANAGGCAGDESDGAGGCGAGHGALREMGRYLSRSLQIATIGAIWSIVSQPRWQRNAVENNKGFDVGRNAKRFRLVHC